jgi:hypothetical protein
MFFPPESFRLLEANPSHKLDPHRTGLYFNGPSDRLQGFGFAGQAAMVPAPIGIDAASSPLFLTGCFVREIYIPFKGVSANWH